MNNDITMDLIKVHQDVDIETFTTNVAGLLSEDEFENIAGAIIGVAYKDGTTKTVSYIANDENAREIFKTIFESATSGLKKLLDLKIR